MLKTKTALILILLFPALSMAGDPIFLKLTVQEKGYTEPNVKVNIPLSLIEVVADAINEEELVDMEEILAEINHEGVDLRKLWEGVKQLGPTDFVEIKDHGEHVKVWKDHDSFRITVTDDGSSEPKVLVTFPLMIVDTILGDGTRPITLDNIVKALKQAGPMQFVEVHDNGEHVKIWLE